MRLQSRYGMGLQLSALNKKQRKRTHLWNTKSDAVKGHITTFQKPRVFFD